MKTQAQNGFTLLEVIVAMSILMFGILAVASMQTSSIRGNDLSISMTEATSMAADRMERLARLPYSDPALAAGNYTDASPPEGNTLKDALSIRWSVTDNTLIPDTKTVFVVVEWKEHGVLKSITLPRVFPRII